ncbi:capsule assembly Wzi family protein [uncultured Draconibacterium sp.]|uniref:capsule assembly Wzi family protein n=1 Tax=uncultured Draconibacterium sp. TaxID=1573823 RepID=UPI0029C7D8E8|nr:capsule assembly Wzi family protein [uncultured Draconibacterium sp.]
MTRKYYLLIALILVVTEQVGAQALSSNFDQLEDYYRREQLLGNIEADYSFVSYPLFPVEAFGVRDSHRPDETTGSFFNRDVNELLGKSLPSDLSLKLLPLVWTNQYNSHHPEDWNDGTMIPAKGYQTFVSGGLYFKVAFGENLPSLSAKIQPEYVYTPNPEYDGFPLTRENPELATLRWAQYYFNTLNYIDQPERFGEDAYNQFNWGQSSVRINYKSISLGFSNENLWWGPGRRNSLLMTNTAPGFRHYTLNTIRPIRTPVGSFEGQIVIGNLKASGYPPPNHEVTDHNGMLFYSPKRQDDRYFNGMILNYSPKWVKGLHLGLIRSFQMYKIDMDDSFDAYLPIFSSFREKKLQEQAEDTEEGQLSNHQKRDSYNSFFMRYVWPKAHVEIYAEYGLADNHWDGRDFVVEMDHSRAFNYGFRKLIELHSEGEVIQVGMEITHLAKNPTSVLRGSQGVYQQGSKTWYTGVGVRQGYTHQGQLLGAGIGPGSNLLSFNVGWNKGLKAIGMQLERYAHNEDFHNEIVKDIRMHWVDLAAALNGSWDYKNLLFSLNLKFVGAKNYQWVYDFNWNEYWDNSRGDDVFNFHGKLGIMYRF